MENFLKLFHEQFEMHFHYLFEFGDNAPFESSVVDNVENDLFWTFDSKGFKFWELDNE